jgi:cobalt/nickel transport system permease protein
MHISEGFLPLSHCIAWGAASLVPTVISVRAISKQVDKKREDRVLLAASAAFLFTLTALRMPSVTGSSSHPTGTAVGTYLFGPSAMPALALVTLVFQALLLAHGGLTTLGANLFSLGVVGPWAMWLLLRLLLRMGWKRDRCIFLSTVVGDLATYVTTAGQLALAYPSAHGGYAASFIKFLGVFLITQIPISIAEGLLTVVLLRNLAADRTAPSSAEGRFRSANAWVLAAVCATMLGAFMYANFTKPLGSDDQAVTAIQNLRPGYHPIAKPLFIPSEAVEPLLFTFQAAIGVAVLAWALWWFRGSVWRWPAPCRVLRPAFSLVHRDCAGRNARGRGRCENPGLELARRPLSAVFLRPPHHHGNSDSDRQRRQRLCTVGRLERPASPSLDRPHR